MTAHNNNSLQLDSKEIRGLNLKFLGTISSLIFSLGVAYNGIVNKIDNYHQQDNYERELIKVEVRQLKLRQDAVEVSIEKLREEVYRTQGEKASK